MLTQRNVLKDEGKISPEGVENWKNNRKVIERSDDIHAFISVSLVMLLLYFQI